MTPSLPLARRVAVAVTVCLLGTAARAQNPTFFLGDGPNKDTATEVSRNVLLRPNAGTPFYPYVNNPTGNDVTVTAVLLDANNRELARSAATVAPANGRATVRLAAANPPAAAPAAGAAATPAAIPLTGSHVRLQLLDDKNKEISRSDLALVFDVPTRYGRATAAFKGTRETDNELLVTVTVAPVSGSPVKLKLDLSHVPGLVPESIKDAAFATEVPAEGGTAVLKASNLRFVGEPRKGWVAVSVDGYDRAFLFETAFDGSTPQRPQAENAVTIACKPAAKPTDKFPIRIEVDQPTVNNPYIEFGFDKSGTGVFETRVLPGDRRRAATLTLAGPDDPIVFGSVVEDWALDVNAAGVLGTRTLRARLLAPKGDRRDPANDTELRADLRQVFFDDSPPEAVKLTLPPTHPRGTSLTVRAVATDVESGVDRVLFFVGDPPAPEVRGAVRGRVYLAEPGTAGGTFTAVLPMADVKGPAVVGVRVVNGVGLVTDATGEVLLIDPPAAKAKPTIGDIKGVVVQGSDARPQPGLAVYLIDEKKTATLKETATNAKGEFAFKDLAPGNYNVFTSKPTDRTTATKAVTVEAGKTSEVTLALTRQPTAPAARRP